jgi:hypothetical protein
MGSLSILFAFILFSAAVPDEVPSPPPGTLPMYSSDPVLPGASDPAGRPGFACFGACGASCDCVDKKLQTIESCANGKRCRWKTVSCKTYNFCRWHDRCYLTCDFQYPGIVDDGNFRRFLCYRGCDLSCIDGSEPKPAEGWNVTSPGAPPEALGTEMCTRRMSWDPGVPYDPTPLIFADDPTCEPDPKC